VQSLALEIRGVALDADASKRAGDNATAGSQLQRFVQACEAYYAQEDQRAEERGAGVT
jgi:hypothetical protein